MIRNFYMKHVRKGTQNIKRFQMEDVLKPQSLAEHGYHTMNLFLIACNFTGYKPTVKELDKVLNHDTIETLTGDLNKLVKEMNPETQLAWETIEDQVTREMEPENILYMDDNGMFSVEFNELLKFCDGMEAYLYCAEEVYRGNANFDSIQDYYYGKLQLMNGHLFEYITGDR